MNSFVVLGIGRFGESIAKNLYEIGSEVMVIDQDEDIIQHISDHVTHAVVGDVTDENVLKSLAIKSFDVAIVAIGGDLESSIMVTLLLKELGVKYIVAKAQSELHAKVLSKVGADKVVFPERDMGSRIAHNLVSDNILEYLELSPDYSIVEVTLPKDWEGKSLKDLNIRAKYGINIMAIKNHSGINISPRADDALKRGDVLVAIGSNEDLNILQKR